MSSRAEQRRTLVTGGAGFIGSHLVERLVARGDRVTVVDDLSTGRRQNLDGVDPDRLRFIHAEVSEGVKVLYDDRFDQIYHLAAAVGVRLVIDRPIGTIETNVLETSAILEFASRQGVPTLLASTSEVYGKSSQIPFAEEDDVVYGPPRQARWAYACSKAIDEFLALAYHQQRGLPVVVTRFFNVVGPRQLGEYGMVLPRLIEQVNAGKSMEVHGDGLQTRCFCDVRDVVAVLPTLLDAHAGDAPVVNIGDDRSITILDLAKLVRETLRSEAEIVMVPYEEAFGPGFDDMRHRQPNLRRIREMTGFTPTIGLEQTIRDVAAEIAAARQGQPT